MSHVSPASKSTGSNARIPPVTDSAAPGWPMLGLSLLNPGAIDGIHRMSELQMSLTRFAAECAQRNVTLFAALASCRSPVEYLETWRRASTEAISAYADEAARIVELGRG